jgi:hypothetical protein
MVDIWTSTLTMLFWVNGKNDISVPPSKYPKPFLTITQHGSIQFRKALSIVLPIEDPNLFLTKVADFFSQKSTLKKKDFGIKKKIFILS